jgi:uncharacterized protein YcnI
MKLIAILALAAMAAQAHVTVWPKTSSVGAYEKYSVRVPNEKDSPTVRVELEYPAAITALYFERKAGWTVEHRRDSKGKIISTVWTGGSIAPEEFAEFQIIARNPAQAGELVWKAVQFHVDGSRSEWTSGEDSPTPAPRTSVSK